jgi:hypothetical protein
MDTEIQSTTQAPQTNERPTYYAPSNSHRLVFGLLSLLILIVGMCAVYFWQHEQVEQLNSKLDNYQATLVKDSKISLDYLNALSALPNIVVDKANSPTDLIAFLGSDNTQCYKNNGSGYYNVVAQADDQFAKMQYGCTSKDGNSPLGTSPSFILAKKTNNKWSLISPTNQWQVVNGQDEPSCTMVNDNKFSKLVTPQCWQGPILGSSNSNNNQQITIVSVSNP